MKYDCVLIGSGISSLTSALLLAKAGHSVCVLEQHYKVGGYLHSFKRFQTTFDTGAHYIGSMDQGQAFRVLLEYLGVYHPDDYYALDPNGFDRFEYPSVQVEFAKGYAQTFQNLCQSFPERKKEIQIFLQLVYKAANSFPTYRFNADYDEEQVLNYLKISLQEVLNQVTSDPKLQTVLASYAYLHGVKPQDVAFGLHSLVMDSLISSAYAFKNSGQVLADRFVTEIKKYGGDVLTKHQVSHLKVKEGRIHTVECENGKSFSANWVISGIHPKACFQLVEGEKLRPAFAKRVQKMSESESFFGIYARLPHPNPFLPKKNYFYFRSEKPEDILKLYPPQNEPTGIYLYVPNRGDLDTQDSSSFSLLGPGPYAWFQNWSQLSYTERRKAGDYQNFKKQIAENYLSFLHKRCPQFDYKAFDYETSTPLSNLHFNGSLEGSAYGIYHSINNTGVRALGPRTQITNLLLTGQNTLFPGLLAACISGLRTTGHILGIKTIVRELQHRQTGWHVCEL